MWLRRSSGSNPTRHPLNRRLQGTGNRGQQAGASSFCWLSPGTCHLSPSVRLCPGGGTADSPGSEPGGHPGSGGSNPPRGTEARRTAVVVRSSSMVECPGGGTADSPGREPGGRTAMRVRIPPGALGSGAGGWRPAGGRVKRSRPAVPCPLPSIPAVFRPCSSADESAGLRIQRSQVRILAGALGSGAGGWETAGDRVKRSRPAVPCPL